LPVETVEAPAMRLLRMRFRIWHFLVVVAFEAVLVGLLRPLCNFEAYHGHILIFDGRLLAWLLFLMSSFLFLFLFAALLYVRKLFGEAAGRPPA
jgi:hypothetical protein